MVPYYMNLATKKNGFGTAVDRSTLQFVFLTPTSTPSSPSTRANQGSPVGTKHPTFIAIDSVPI